MLNPKTRILLWADNLWYFGEGMLGPLFAVFTERIGGDILDISWAWAAYLIATGVFIMIVGKISDKKGMKEKLIISGYILNAIFTFGYLLVNSPLRLLLLQIGLGIATALATPTWDALYAKYEDRKHDGMIWGLSDGQAHLFSGLAIIAGGAVVAFLSFSALFIIMGIIQIISVYFMVQILKKGDMPFTQKKR